jgi:hypothetical protein
MTDRARLPNRRASEQIAFECSGFRCVASVPRFPDGRIAEKFLNAAKSGTQVEPAARDGAIVASLGLQHAVPADAIRDAISRNGDGSASGPIGHVLDLLAIEA